MCDTTYAKIPDERLVTMDDLIIISEDEGRIFPGYSSQLHPDLTLIKIWTTPTTAPISVWTFDPDIPGVDSSVYVENIDDILYGPISNKTTT